MKNLHFFSGLLFVGCMSIILTKNTMEMINDYLHKETIPPRTINFNNITLFELRDYPFKKLTFCEDKTFDKSSQHFDEEKLAISLEVSGIKYIHKASLFYHYGLRCVDDEIRNYITNKDVVHIGSRMGEAVYVLSKYTNGKIICLDSSYSDVETFNKFILDNKLSKVKYVYDKVNVTGENCAVDFSTVGISGELKYNACKLDEYLSKNDGKIGAIIVSGSVLDHPLFPLHLYSNSRREDPLINLLRGSLETIKKHRPILSMPYYYSFEFSQEIEKFITENLPDYKFVRYWGRCVRNSCTPFGEFLLFGYPQELSHRQTKEE